MLLENIKSPSDLKNLNQKEMNVLASEIREKIISTVATNGGHLASNLGVVELTLALHKVFNSPSDAIIWDVSHQCYTHKLLTGRYEEFNSLRQKDGISGFTRIKESEHDYFDAGHASSSISSALGLLTAWKAQGRNDKVVAVIGDGALTGGMAFEGLSHAGQLNKNLIVVLNDNQMSISKNVGSISRYLSRLTTTSAYQSFRHKFDRAVDMIPYFNRSIGKFIYRFKRGLKGLFLTNNLFVDLGFEYVGPLNGHNIEQMERIFERAKKIPRPVVVHVVTKKGKGYENAEKHPSEYHGVSPFDIKNGLSSSTSDTEHNSGMTFTDVFGKTLIRLAQKDSKIVAITAAMAKGTGLYEFSKEFKDRFFDVGIAEEHAVTFAGGLAAGGMKSVVAIYSTFIQRSIDQIIEDVCLQNRHVVIALDRAGAVGGDGETHQGIFDISLLRPIPNLKILSPATKLDFEKCLDWALNKNSCPVAIRYPKLKVPKNFIEFDCELEEGRGVLVKSEKSLTPSKNLIVCTGSLFSEVNKACTLLSSKNIFADIYSLRFIKPFDEDEFLKIASNYKNILFAEDGVKLGSVSVYLESVLRQNSKTFKIKTKILAFPDYFVANGTRSQVLDSVGLSSEKIALEVKNLNSEI